MGVQEISVVGLQSTCVAQPSTAIHGAMKPQQLYELIDQFYVQLGVQLGVQLYDQLYRQLGRQLTTRGLGPLPPPPGSAL